MAGDQSGMFRTISCAGCGATADQHRILMRTQVTLYGSFKGSSLTMVICPNCGLVFLQPQPEPEALGRFYRHEYYTNLIPPDPIDSQKLISAEKWKKDFLHSWLIDKLPDAVRDWDILDVGSGCGVWLQWFDRSNRLVAIEQSEQAAEIAASVFGIQVHQVDFMENQLEGQQFNLLTGLAVIEHFVDPFAALSEMNRLLRQGGYLYLQTPDIHGVVFRPTVERALKLVHTFYFSLATLSDILRRAGFEIIAYRQRPPLVETSNLWRPYNNLQGELDILAQKRHETTLTNARALPPSSGESIDSVLASIARAHQRDRFFIWFSELQKNRVFNKASRELFRVMRRCTQQRSVWDEQAIRLGINVDPSR